ncbi:hypothetical protein KPL74_09135 [Bacillus sp. NP157]|nr:hypothetical protein KPL74_09135 [Bacillus sp. NP157]
MHVQSLNRVFRGSDDIFRKGLDRMWAAVAMDGGARSRVRRVLLACVAALGACGILVPATHAEVAIPGHVSTLWHTRDGAPGDINALAQTEDGWIWLGTSAGLYRFDGRNFFSHDLVSDETQGSRLVTDLSAGRDGGLWVVYGNRTAIHLSGDGRTVTIPRGLPADRIGHVAEAGDGRTFVSAAGQLFVLSGDHWVACPPPQWRPPEGDIQQTVATVSGGTLALTGTGVFWLARYGRVFERLSSHSRDDEDLVVAVDGGVWRSEGKRHMRIPRERGLPRERARSSDAIEFEDGSGGLWAQGSGCANLCYRPEGLSDGESIMAGDEVIHFPLAPDGLLVMSTMLDSSGSLWVGGKEGLARIRPASATPVVFDGASVYFAVSRLRDGRMLVGTDAHGGTDRLWLMAGPGQAVVTPGVMATTAMAADGDGALLGGHGTLSALHGDRLEALPFPAFLGGELVQVVVPDGEGDGAMWVSVRGHGLFRLSHGAWQKNGGLPGLPDGWPLSGATDGRGGMWFGYPDGTVAHVHGKQVEAALQTGLGTVTAILPGSPLVAGGERGAAWYDGSNFRPLRLRMGALLRGVTGLVRTSAGDLWINARSGLSRIRAAQFAAVTEGRDGDAAFDLFNDATGLPGGAQQTRPLPTLTLDARNMLWVAATSGLVTVAADVASPTQDVRPVILSMSTARRSLESFAGDLDPDETALSVAWTGLSLTDPAHMQFRVRLGGTDQEWRVFDGPGNVQYAGLPPGRYRFEIQARGTDGDWSALVSSGDVVRRPALFETAWFRALVALLFVAGLVGLYALRIRALHRRAAERATARLAERDRIARELHDSMLQGMMGVAMRLEAWRDDARLPEWIRPSLTQGTARLLALLLEGRARVIALRSVGEMQMPLSEALRLIGDDHASSWPARFVLTVSGIERRLDEQVHIAVIDILREAVHNAFVHAEPKSVAVTLDYTNEGLVAIVDDDGLGLPPDVVDQGKRAGHWGLVTMRERASRIGAVLSISSDAIGTSVSLIARDPPQLRHAWLRRWWPWASGVSEHEDI